MQCTAKSKRTGEQCKNHAVQGMTVCRFHGGKSLKGAASPSFKHGRYSKYLPEQLKDRYHEAQRDPELLAMREEIALMDTRISDLLKRSDTGDSAGRWALAAKLLAEYRKEENPYILKQLEQVIAEGLGDFAIWQEIGAFIEQRRKLVETERKRLVEMQQMITSEQAVSFAMAIITSVKRNVTDRKALAAIQEDLVRLLDRDSVKALTDAE